MSALRALKRDERGFAMIVVILVLMIVMMAGAAALATTSGDERSGSYSQDTKQAYAATQAGLGWYLAQLQSDPNYWLSCTNHTVPGSGSSRVQAPLNNPWTSGSTDPRTWSTIGTSNAAYTIELLPANGKSACSTTDPIGTMVDSTTGTMRIRITGRGRATGGPKRSVIVTLRRTGFLDFIYFTDLEDMDPKLWLTSSDVTTSTPDVVDWVNQNCTKHWWEGRSSARYTGTVRYAGSSSNTSYTNADLCGGHDIQFASFDSVNGPFHSNDSILVCGKPIFGRDDKDKFELQAPSTSAWRSACGAGDGLDNVKGTKKFGAFGLPLPPDNKAIMRNVTPGYLFTGKTSINLKSTTMDVTDTYTGQTWTDLTIPTNGVIYVQSDNCTTTYDPSDPYGAPDNCGDVYVHGSYSQNITIGAEKDIVVDGDITRNGDYTLGLVANNFVRVKHTCGQAANSNRTIQAAILTVNDSFLVDNWTCDSLGQLNITGAIAQHFRGVVGTGSGSSHTGYAKNYVYDDRLRYRSPPKFLDPVRSAWQPARTVEQVPAT